MGNPQSSPIFTWNSCMFTRFLYHLSEQQGNEADLTVLIRKAPIWNKPLSPLISNYNNFETEDNEIPFIFLVPLYLLKIHRICMWWRFPHINFMCWGSPIPFHGENYLSFQWNAFHIILVIPPAIFHAIGNLKDAKASIRCLCQAHRQL